MARQPYIWAWASSFRGYLVLCICGGEWPAHWPRWSTQSWCSRAIWQSVRRLGWEMAAEFCLRASIHASKVLLHAVNLRHGTDGFASPPKEVVLRIFITLKNRPGSGSNPRTLRPVASTLTTSPPRATILILYCHINLALNIFFLC
jgi:hypothetical protein